MTRRGITLTEVLVAIFVTGLGLMALMTLFPLGAVNMSLAIKDDRAAHCAANAAALLRTVWRQGLESGQPDPTFQQLALGQPIYLDPIGNMTYAAPSTGSIAGAIPRMPLHYVAGQNGARYIWAPMPPAAALQYFSLMDDIEFDFNGAPITRYGLLPRETLYSWAIMLRPPAVWLTPQNLATQNVPPTISSIPPRAVEYAVVVYNRRGVAGLNQAPESPAYGATYNFNGNNNAIFVPVGTQKLQSARGLKFKIHKGSWVLDVSPFLPPFRVPHSYFYRVDSVTPGTKTTLLTVDQPLRGFDDIQNKPWPGGKIVFMDNVVEVFEKSTLE